MSKAVATALLAALCSALPRPAHAYIDPGSGSYVFQMLIAGFLSFAFAVRHYWDRLRSFITRQRSERGEDNGDGDSAS